MCTGQGYVSQVRERMCTGQGYVSQVRERMCTGQGYASQVREEGVCVFDSGSMGRALIFN